MLCAIYKSLKRSDCYLYVPARTDFNHLPEQLMQYFGQPKFVMVFNLAGKKKLARLENSQVIEAIATQGYYLQLLPQQQNLLQQHLQQAKAQSEPSPK